MKKKALFYFSLILFFISGISFVFFTYKNELGKKRELKETIKDIQLVNKEAASKMKFYFKSVEEKVNFLAEELSKRKYSEKEINDKLYEFLKKDDFIFGISVCFEPYKFEDQRKLYGPYFLKRNGDIKLEYINDSYDYTDLKNEGAKWYTIPATSGKGGWVEPYFGNVSQKINTEYSKPFFNPYKKDEVFGVITVTFTSEDIKNLINNFDIEKSGYAFLMSKEGILINHPKNSLVKKKTTLMELAEEINDKNLYNMALDAIAGNNSYINHKNIIINQDSWLVYNQVGVDGWTLVSMFIKIEQLKNIEHLKHRYMLSISLGMLTLVFLVLSIVLNIKNITGGVLIKAVMIITIIFALGIAIMWRVVIVHAEFDIESVNRVKNFESINEIKNVQYENSEKGHYEKPKFIKTGIFLKSIEFSNSNNVIVTGYIWQKYDLKEDKDIKKGFIMPEAESSEIKEVYRKIEGKTEIIGWNFNATLREKFYYKNYPLEFETLWIRFWHSEFQKNIILIPDFNSYRTIYESSLPGVDEDLVLPGWDIKGSYFSYTNHSYNSNFGLSDYIGQDSFPELYYNVELQRQFVNPFVSKIIPLIIVLCMLYATLALGVHKNSSPLEVIAGCSALFFVVIIDHINLRESLAATNLIYFEYFYFITYFMILFVSINAVILPSEYNWKFFEYKENLLPKIFYWPGIMVVIFIITLKTFY